MQDLAVASLVGETCCANYSAWCMRCSLNMNTVDMVWYNRDILDVALQRVQLQLYASLLQAQAVGGNLQVFATIQSRAHFLRSDCR